jgi:hypothetical protein
MTRYEERREGVRTSDDGTADLRTDPQLPLESLRLRLRGKEAPRVLALRGQEVLARAASVASVHVRYLAQDHDLAVLDEVDYTGGSRAGEFARAIPVMLRAVMGLALDMKPPPRRDRPSSGAPSC